MSSADPAPFDPVLAAMERAPVVQRLTAQQREELAQDIVDIAAGRAVLVAHEDVPRVLEELGRAV